MKVHRIKSKRGYIVRLEQAGTVYTGEGKTLGEAMSQAFKLYEGGQNGQN